jgi:isopenicillin N synthase-like dioxygenase
MGSDENTIDYNIWLPDDVLPGFRQLTTDCYWAFNKVAATISDALIMSLELTAEEEESVRTLFNKHKNQLRLLHYPPVGEEYLTDTARSRLGAHTDFR